MRPTITAFAAVLIASMFACTGFSFHDAPDGGDSGDRKEPDAGFSVVSPPPELPLPNLQVDVNGVRFAELQPGWPLRVEVLLSHPDRLQTLDDGGAPLPIPISNSKGPWFDRATVRLRTTAGAQIATLDRFTTPPQPTELASDQLLGAAFELQDAATSSLSPGDYVVDVEVPWAIDGAEDVRLHATRSVHVAPPSQSVETDVQKAELTVAMRYMKDDLPGALATADALVLQHPDAPGALALKAEVLEASGDKAAAYALFRQAIQATDGGASMTLRSRTDQLGADLGKSWLDP